MAKRRTRKTSKPRTDGRQSSVSRKPSKTARKTAVPSSAARTRKPTSDGSVASRDKKAKRGKGKAPKRAVPKPKGARVRTARQRARVEISARSLAAKKGWLTRRYNQQVKAIEERYERREREQQKEIRKQAKALAGKEKVVVYMREQLREKGQEITKQVDKAIKRAKSESDNEFKQKLEILERLYQAQLDGEFDQVAYDLADEYDMDAREIYTLWHYNGAVD
jgi:hypothetical protein